MTRARSLEAPRALERGARIAVIAPGSRIVRPALGLGIDVVRRWGFVPVLGAHLDAEYGDLAGTDDQRALDLAWALSDPEIDAVWAARGGWGTVRAMALVDMDLAMARPRLVLGSSDITPLLEALRRRGVLSLHAPLVADLGRPERFVRADLRARLSTPGAAGSIGAAGGRSATLVPGSARGPLVGGCLSLVVALLGTPWALDLGGAVVFLEDVGEAPYRVDRLLWQLAASGALDHARGLVFGHFERCDPPPSRPSRSVEDVLRAHATAIGIPALMGLPVGHGPKTRTLPMGAPAHLDATARRLHIGDVAQRRGAR